MWFVQKRKDENDAPDAPANDAQQKADATVAKPGDADGSMKTDTNVA